MYKLTLTYKYSLKFQVISSRLKIIIISLCFHYINVCKILLFNFPLHVVAFHFELTFYGVRSSCCVFINSEGGCIKI